MSAMLKQPEWCATSASGFGWRANPLADCESRDVTCSSGDSGARHELVVRQLPPDRQCQQTPRGGDHEHREVAVHPKQSARRESEVRAKQKGRRGGSGKAIEASRAEDREQERTGP